MSDETVAEPAHRVVSHLDRVLEERGMTLTELAERAGVSVVNLSVLKNNRARAIRFSTLTAVCDVLDCQPGDLLAVSPARATGRPSLRLRDRGADDS
jgi:putative transcriptional regulator